jgi:hypothetical protein
MANSKISALTSATTPLAGTETLPVVQSSATTKVTVANLTAGRAVSATQYTSTIATGTAPLVVSSTTNVANLNASSLSGATFAAPGAIGGGTASAITGTTITGTDTTDATSTTAAALKTAGGLAVVKKMYIGDNVVIGTSGKGVDFSIVTHGGSTSKLLADYEEGTFTPTLTRSGTAPTVTYTTQKGFYTKVGNAVTCTVYLAWSANAGGTGYWYAASLPFTSKNSASCIASSAIGDYTGFTLAVGTTQLGLEVNPNVTYGVFQCSGSAVSSNVINTVAATGFVILTVTYFTA